MGGKEKVPRPARVTQSGQEANRKRRFGVLLGNPGKDITPWLTLKSKKSSWLDCGFDRGAKGRFTTRKISDHLLVPEKKMLLKTPSYWRSCVGLWGQSYAFSA